MATFRPNKQHLREVILFHYNSGKSAAESHRLLSETYQEHAPEEITCRRWFARFKSGDLDVKDKERTGQPKKFEDAELEAVIGQDPCQTQSQLAELLAVSREAIAKRLKKLNYVEEQGKWCRAAR